MFVLWIALGSALIIFGIIEMYMTLINYNTHGLIFPYFQRLNWHFMRAVISRIPPLDRKIQLFGLQLLIGIMSWVIIESFGFGLIYYAMMNTYNFSFSGTAQPDFWDAIYVSVGQLSTVGNPTITANSNITRTLTIIETAISLILISLIISFITNIYQAINSLITWSSELADKAGGTNDPMKTLEVYYARDPNQSLDDFLQGQYSHLQTYFNSLRLYYLVYYFFVDQSTVALPYVLTMLTDIISTLHWGIRVENKIFSNTLLPKLLHSTKLLITHLNTHFVHAPEDSIPAARTYTDFAEACVSEKHVEDIWLNHFLLIDRRMRILTQDTQPIDPQEAYRRYCDWLPFFSYSMLTIKYVARDLRYKPMPSQSMLQYL